MAGAQDVDVQQVMERIRENIRRRRSVETGPESEPTHTGSHEGGGTPELARLQALGDLRKIPLSSHRWLVGRLVLALKRVLFKLLTPILEQQTIYNTASARAATGIAHEMQTLERRQAHALQAATEQLAKQFSEQLAEQRSEQLAEQRSELSKLSERCSQQISERSQAQLSELRALLDEEVARVKSDLIARMAQEARAREQVNGTALQLRDEMRGELAAQWPAIEAARRATSALRERLSASDRRWRRVLHVLQPEGPPRDGLREPRPPAEARPPSELEPEFDYAGFEERFRGSEEDIRDRQRMYVPYFRDARNVLDLGCGRGEFLELLREEKIEARGLDLDLDMVLLCREKELDVVRGDAFSYLDALADDTLGGIFAAQVVEHLPPRRVIDLVKLCHRKLAPGGVLVLETPNPGCLMVFADSFYRDLSHFQPIHPDTLEFLFEAAGFRSVETRFSGPVDPAMRVPPLQLPGADVERLNQGIERLNTLLFGFQDYAVIGAKTG